MVGEEKGSVVDNIVRKAIQNHVEKDYLMPHGWVILGHDGNNIEKLREDYQAELEERFKGKQQYILSTARMFQGDPATYILLEQHCSTHCPAYANVHRSILVPAISTEGTGPGP